LQSVAVTRHRLHRITILLTTIRTTAETRTAGPAKDIEAVEAEASTEAADAGVTILRTTASPSTTENLILNR
jgi:hypothetical protein